MQAHSRSRIGDVVFMLIFLNLFFVCWWRYDDTAKASCFLTATNKNGSFSTTVAIQIMSEKMRIYEMRDINLINK
jgi:hypothetical protein